MSDDKPVQLGIHRFGIPKHLFLAQVERLPRGTDPTPYHHLFYTVLRTQS